jgi:nondiscriminating aspartyl-tRNA synthetase
LVAGDQTTNCQRQEIPTIHFAEAQRVIKAGTGERTQGEPDLAPAHERWLGEWARRRFDSEFLFVVGYPMVKRPFYTHPQPDQPECSNSFDLLFRGLNIRESTLFPRDLNRLGP